MDKNQLKSQNEQQESILLKQMFIFFIGRPGLLESKKSQIIQWEFEY